MVGHYLGYFAGSLLLSANLPIEGLTAEDLADRLSAAAAAPSADDAPPALSGDGFLPV